MLPKSSVAQKVKSTFDRDFQRRIVRLLYLDPNFAVSVADDLSADLFESKVDRFLAGTMIDMKKSGYGISKSGLINEIRKAKKSGKIQPASIEPLMKVVASIDGPLVDRSYIASEVHNFVHHQKVLDALFTSADLLDRNDFKGVLKKMRGAVEYDPSPQNTTGTRLMRDVGSRIARRKAFEKNGIPTGTPLDNYLVHEGLPPKQIGIVMAPAGRGKTATLVHFAKSAVLNKPIQVVHYTLELSEEVIGDRYDAAFSKIQLNELQAREKDVKKAYQALGASIGDCIIIKEFPTRSLTVNGIRSHLKRLESEAFRPGMIIVDYAGLMKCTDKYTERYHELGAIVEELRGLAVELNVPIWTALQANRQSLSKERITIEDLAESFQPAMTADVIVAICQTDKEKQSKKARFFIAKNRNGVADVEFAVRLDTAAVNIRAI
jgi:replicative DNA helicase